MFNRLTPVVKNLIIINALFFLATLILKNTSHIDLEQTLSLYHWSSPKFRPYQIITHMFMHGGFMHIFFNMFGLFMFGPILEQVWGGKRFFIYYMVCGLGAAFVYMMYETIDLHQMQAAVNAFAANPSVLGFEHFFDKYVPLKELSGSYSNAVAAITSGWTAAPHNMAYAKQGQMAMQQFVNFKANIPVLGASGAIYGVLLAFGILFPNTELMLIFPPIPMKAKYFVLIFGGIELFSGFENNPYDNVAHFAHLGGMLFGFILLMIWKRNSKHFY